MRLCILVLLLSLAIAPSASQAQTAANGQKLSWVKVAEHAGSGAARTPSGELVYNGKMWLLGGLVQLAGPVSQRRVEFRRRRPLEARHAGGPLGSRGFAHHAGLRQQDVDHGRLVQGAIAGRLGEQSGVVVDRRGQMGVCHRQGRLARERVRPAAVHNGKMWILGGVERYYDGDSF